MNKKNITILFLVLLTQTIKAGEIKALAGMNSSKYLFSNEIDSLNRQQRTGFNIGLGWAFSLNQNMQLEINALYSQKGAKTTITYTPDKTVSGVYKNSNFGFPILLKYKLKKAASPYAAFGPECIIIASHHLKIPESNDDFNLGSSTKKFVLAINVLLGYEWPIGRYGFFVEIRYNSWLNNFYADPEAKIRSESMVFLLGGMYYL